VTCLLWSGGWLFIRVGVSEVPPLTLAAARLALAALVLLPWVIARGGWRGLSRDAVATIAASGVLLLGVNYALVFWGAQFVPSALTALLQATTPLFAFLIAGLLGLERFTAVRAAAIVTGLAGVAIVARGQMRLEAVGGWGSLAIVGGALCAAAAYAIVKMRAPGVAAETIVAGQTVCALVLLATAALLVDGDPLSPAWTPRALLALGYLGLVSSVAAFWLNYWLLRRTDTTTVLSTAMVQPLMAAVLGAAFLDERLGLHAIIGGACILSSATVILRR
jgi:drug/metabolite transporter (DMT)-like permease